MLLQEIFALAVHARVVSNSQCLMDLLAEYGCPLHSAAELWTTNLAYLPAAVFEGRANLLQLAKNWFFSFFGNLVGSLLCVWLIDEVLHSWPKLLYKNALRSQWTKRSIAKGTHPICICMCISNLDWQQKLKLL